MATTTSSKAKTKTAKKSTKTAKASTKTTSTTTKKVAPKKTVLAKETSKTPATAKTSTPGKVKKPRTALDASTKLRIFSAVVFTGLAVAAVLLMTSAAYTLTVSYLTRDALASQATTVFAPGSQAIMDVEVRYALALLLGVAAVFALISATVLRKRYQQQVNYGVVPLRWIGLGIILAIMAEIVLALSGAQDLAVIKLVSGLMFIYVIFAYLTERRHALGLSSKATFLGGLAALSLPVLLVVGYSLNTYIYGMIRYPWYVYAVQVTFIVGLLLITKNQLKQIKMKKKWTDPVFVEKKYAMINFLALSVFAAILILGLQSS